MGCDEANGNRTCQTEAVNEEAETPLHKAEALPQTVSGCLTEGIPPADGQSLGGTRPKEQTVLHQKICRLLPLQI